METGTMGRVTVRATIENAYDLRDAQRGLLAADMVRRVDVPDALVDTGATTLSVPKRLIEQLGTHSLSQSPGTHQQRPPDGPGLRGGAIDHRRAGLPR